MCGICGWVNLSGETPSEETLTKMVSALRHRGPDKQDYVVRPGVGLGIARLAINDIEGGHQPYRNEDGSIWAVFNGEIYNFRELRTTLEHKGHRFNSKTDGEVIVHLFEEYGPGFVEHLNGMFAIALWDGRQLYLYRDRLGIKPLYIARFAGNLYFASELKSLLQVESFPRRLNHAALRTYLSLEYVPGPQAIFSDVEKLLPGHWLGTTGAGGTELHRYWSLPHYSQDHESLANWSERIADLLSDSVRLRLIADVPVGIFLSGGLDSSTLTSMMCRLHEGPVHTFSVGFSQKSFDESEYSKAVAQHLGTVHHHQTLGPEATLAALEPLAQNIDEPLADPALIPTFLLSKFARQKVTVALSGEGADELLGGYPTYFAHQIAEMLKFFPTQFWRTAESWARRIRPTREYLSFDFKLKKFLSGMGRDPVERHLTWMGAFPWSDSEVLVEPTDHSLFPAHFDLPSRPVERAQALDISTYLVDDLLVKLDRATMAVSLEGRVPFLDHRLVEAVASLPTGHKLRGLDAKRVLKLVEGKRLPAKIIGRRKKGFGVPLSDWLRGPLRPLLETYLAGPYLQQQGLFRPKVVRRLVEEHLLGVADHRKPLWTLLVFQRWAEQYRPV